MNMVRTINNSCKGSVSVEAAVVFPIVILCILPFVYLLRMLLCQMILEKGLDECLKQMAIEMYVLDRVSILPEYDPKEEMEMDQTKIEQLQNIVDEYTSFFEEEGWKNELQEWGYELVGELFLKQKFQEWLKMENLKAWGIENQWNGIDMKESDFLYEEEGHHYLIKGAISFEWKSILSFWKTKTVRIQRVYHCYVGEDTGFGEEDDENEDENGNIIVYRIGQGEKYHSAKCYLINKDIYTSTKSQSEMIGKSPCERCSPGDTVTVYLTTGGEHYHTKDCSYLNPTVTSLKMEEAIRLGYTSCGLCKGGDRYFS